MKKIFVQKYPYVFLKSYADPVDEITFSVQWYYQSKKEKR